MDYDYMKKKLEILKKWKTELEEFPENKKNEIEKLRDKLTELDIKIEICFKVHRDVSMFEDERIKTNEKIKVCQKEMDGYVSQNNELIEAIQRQIDNCDCYFKCKKD